MSKRGYKAWKKECNFKPINESTYTYMRALHGLTKEAVDKLVEEMLKAEYQEYLRS